MSYKITDQTALKNILTAFKASNWQSAYSLTVKAITDNDGNPKTGVDPSVAIWVAGAKDVNANSGAFGHYIRDYTVEQYVLRKGTTSSDMQQRIQKASNDIAKNFVADLLNLTAEQKATPSTAKLNADSGGLPTLHEIGLLDAAGVASFVFKDAASVGNSNHSPWAGTVLFSNLGDSIFFGDWMLNPGTSPQKREAGSYDLISAAQVTTKLKGMSLAIEAIPQLGLYYDLHNIGDATVTAAIASANTFFQQVYGADISTAVINVGRSIYNDVIGGLESAATYKVGKITADTINVDIRNKVVHGGAGNDVINLAAATKGSLQYRVIDGGPGTDSVSYSTFGTPLVVKFDAAGAFNGRAVVHKNSLTSVDTKELLFNIESLTLSEKADKVLNLPNIAPTTALSIFGGGGNDTFTLQTVYSNVTLSGGNGFKDALLATSMVNAITIDSVAGTAASNGATMKISGFEKYTGTTQNDTFYTDAKFITVDGGAGTDLVDFSKATVGVIANNGVDSVILQNIENITGSKFADLINGDGFANTIIGGVGDDTLTGGAGNDSLVGGNDNDYLVGGSDSDTLSGGSGNDTLYGESEDDILNGGADNDSLFGDDGFDTFEFTLASGLNGQDTIDDSDGAGVIKLGSTILSGEAVSVDDGWDLNGYQITADGDDAIIHNGTDTIRIKDFTVGQTKLGITVLQDEPAIEKTFVFNTTVNVSELGGATYAPLTMRYTFDTDLIPGSGSFGTSPTHSSFASISGTLSVGSESVTFTHGEINVFNNAGSIGIEDSYYVRFQGEGMLFGLPVDFMKFVIVDKQGTMFSSTDLPSTPTFSTLADFQQVSVRLTIDPDAEEYVELRVSEFANTPPEQLTPFSLTEDFV